MFTAATDVAAVLGLTGSRPIQGQLDLVQALEEGLPVGAVDRVSRLVAAGDPAFRDRLVARATLTRRRRQSRLTLEESERVERVARLWTRAMRLFRDERKARGFLTGRHMLLRGRSPIDLARTEAGARAVEQILGGLEFGTAV
jgi:putative toxin-antitoxin system antitoxin component (TIGR02293 family)